MKVFEIHCQSSLVGVVVYDASFNVEEFSHEVTYRPGLFEPAHVCGREVPLYIEWTVLVKPTQADQKKVAFWARATVSLKTVCDMNIWRATTVLAIYGTGKKCPSAPVIRAKSEATSRGLVADVRVSEPITETNFAFGLEVPVK